MRRFLLIFAILFLAPIIGHAATCTSTETVTKCAKIPTEIYVEYESTLSAPCTFTYKDVVYSGNKPIISGISATCTINSPLNANVDGRIEPSPYGDTLFVWSSFSFTSKLDGDICPDGFYTVPYNVSCGAGMVDTANVPNCSDDTSGESCLIPATSAPAPEYKFTATIDLSLYNDNIEGIGSPVTEFGFDLGAAGTFYVDWGDGNTETIKKDNTDVVTYTHDYGTTSGTYTVKIGGLATDYSDDEDTPAISFYVFIADISAYSQAITEISGSLGAIFPTLSDGSQPRFPYLFYNAGFAEIPSGLFDGIHGAPVSKMFFRAFSFNNNLTGVPKNLFSGITGAADRMFEDTFIECSGLTSIPENLFAGVTGVAEGMFKRTFYGCSRLTGPSARINGKYLYDLWPNNIAEWGNSMYYDSTGLDDYECIPTDMGGGGETCAPAPEYKFTATINAPRFSFTISAAGTFYVDWGDGTTETIEKPDTTDTTYSHNYSTAGTYTVKIGGLATAYNTSENYATISFADSALGSIDGSLGAIFPTLSDGSQPRFNKTFYETSIASIPETLFAGITGATVNMFKNTFAGTPIASIPETLFAGITGAAESMFEYTFASTPITSIPETLFAGITGAAEGMFLYTFQDTGITSIPENLFSGITDGAANMFYGTFAECFDLTGPSARINGKYLYDLWPNNISKWGVDMYAESTGLDDYECIPTVMGGGGESCLMPATCTSTETVTKCAKISTNYEKIDYEVLSDTEYIIYFRSNGYGYTVPVHGIATETACTLTTAPFERSTMLPPVVPGDTAAKSCAEGSFFAINNLTASETDICPDGFFTMPYDVSCGAGMVDTANVPNCSDDTSGESCLIPATSAPAPEYKFTATTISNTSSFAFYISAAGTFYVDWGDGTTETIEKPDTTFTTYSHNYSTKGKYIVKIGGLATAYNSDRTVASISFNDSALGSIDGSLGAIFPTLADGGQPSFYHTFSFTDITSIPENLFRGITGAAEGMFEQTFRMTSITSIPENLFSGITGAAKNMFRITFSETYITSIPENLFRGITGAAEGMFEGTFRYNQELTSIPNNLFAGITGVANNMFRQTFTFCEALTGPSARINGKYLYELWPDNVAEWGSYMYDGATGLSDYACIPTDMGGGGESCEPAPEYKFTATIDLSLYNDNTEAGVGLPVTEFGFDLGAAGTFYVDWGDGNTETIKKDNTDAVTYTHDYGTTSGTYTVKIGGLATDYSDDKDTPAISFGVDVSASSAYSQAITEISGSLGAIFPTLSDASQPRFIDLFYQSRIRAIPSGLFDGIHGVPVSNMFRTTFDSCSYLTSIPENLFSGITGAAEGMFEYTFYECSGLTSIPENLFSGITNGATNMFYGTFMNTPITSIPENLFSGITDTADRMFGYTFQGCSMLTGPSARINGKYLYELWPDNVAEWGPGMYEGATGLDDYACIPTVMGGGGETCEPAPQYKFTATIDLSLYEDNQWSGGAVTEFGFNLGAAGTFYVDWGDGNTETIEKDNTDAVTYTHDYGTTSGTYTVKIDGLATDYSDDEYTPAISFYVDVAGMSTYSQAITAILGSLGAIFPTLSDGSQPRFMDLFYQSYIRAIPSGLFDGIHGVPVSNMFRGAFDSCPYLTSIPEKLFAGITGAAAGMFEYTFSYCSLLTGPSARINGKYLYELWPDNVAEWGSYMYDGATGLSDYACIPTDMGGGGETCEPTPEVLCTIGISQIKISTGVSFALYAEKYTQPSLAIKYNDGICYGKLEQGNQSGTMNFNYNGTVYHLAN